jgi:fluoride exporter
MERFFWICLAGAAGTGARYLITLWATQRFGPAFPLGTLLVNLSGCFLIAFLVQLGLSWAWSPTLRAALTIGFLGGLTTYSSFNYDTSVLLRDGATGAAVLNLGVTVVGGLAAGWLGLIASRQVVGP